MRSATARAAVRCSSAGLADDQEHATARVACLEVLAQRRPLPLAADKWPTGRLFPSGPWIYEVALGYSVCLTGGALGLLAQFPAERLDASLVDAPRRRDRQLAREAASADGTWSRSADPAVAAVRRAQSPGRSRAEPPADPQGCGARVEPDCRGDHARRLSSRQRIRVAAPPCRLRPRPRVGPGPRWRRLTCA